MFLNATILHKNLSWSLKGSKKNIQKSKCRIFDDVTKFSRIFHQKTLKKEKMQLRKTVKKIKDFPLLRKTVWCHCQFWPRFWRLWHPLWPLYETSTYGNPRNFCCGTFCCKICKWRNWICFCACPEYAWTGRAKITVDRSRDKFSSETSWSPPD